MSSNILTFNAYSGIDPSIMQIHNEINVYYYLRFYPYFGINPSSVVQFRMYPGKTELLARVLKMLRFGF